ncbi:methyltransferase domain-containing protein [Corynebacterium testudinoris]|uniref:23S rRNA m(1)G-748 methyltransferase n=1 Tax=Corynebacterium testudinoris TaxID=136857 RepID=A0A0G3H4T7_9CORY|nr:methyltransferase domain-containing protein [Corynebacterium testudinoris]AKK08426.1 23S rRNA m(1)G-748 methyltransferase [Corynebacterium testudinoris]MBX8994638.1 methyltransferase domain-containing protein [Corynebacterium testudinoris]
MLSDIIDVLADPVDGSPLSGADDYTRLVSETGHSYDVARQGYVTLAGGSGLRHSGDSMDMVLARETFLSHGHFAPFVEAVTAGVHDALDDNEVPLDARPVIAEVGAGTGYYLSHTLDDVESSRGVGIDVSSHAVKHLARSHQRVGSIAADVWERLPLRDNSIDVITVVFAPRNAAEFARVLVPGGQAVILTADRGHLSELRDPLGIIEVEEGKVERLLEQFAGHLELVGEPELIEFPMTLDKESIAAQIKMSPSARHIGPEELNSRVAALPETMTITARARLTRLAKAPRSQEADES